MFGWSALGCLVVEVLLVLGDMAHHPHVYAATLYGRSVVTAALLRGVSGTQPSGWYAAALVLPVVSLVALALRGLGPVPRWHRVVGGAR